MRKSFIIIVSLFITMTIVQLRNYTIIESKIVYEFSEHSQDLSTDEVKEYISDFGKVNIVTRFNYNSFQVENTLSNDATMEEVDEYKKRVFTLGKKYHKTLNEKYASTLDLLNYESCYISEYTPYVEYEFDEDVFSKNINEILGKLSSNKNIQKVFVKDEQSNVQDKLEGGLIDTKSYNYLVEERVSGSGVKVGMIETGYPDFTHENLDTVSHTVFNLGPTVVPTDHATKVASIICGEHGIAKGASLYCTGMYGNNNVSEMDWLINRGVDIVNMSFGEMEPPSIYGSDSALADYMVLTYNIVVCAAVGNEGQGNGKIGNPGLGYNVIGVGTSDSANYVTSYSSYNELNASEKPTVVAPGDLLVLEGFDNYHSGTSFSSAFATGLLTLLLNKYPILKTKAMQVVAMVCATSGMNTYYSFNQANGFDEYAGAGVIDFQRLYDNINKITSINNINRSHDRLVYEWDIYISSGKTIRACFAWGAYSNTSNNTAVFTNYDVVIKDQNGNILSQTNSTKDNVEVATAYADYTGTYYLQLYQRSDFPDGQSGDIIYFSYRYR